MNDLLLSAAAHGVLLRNSEVLLVRRCGPIAFSGLWSLPGGRVEREEGLLAAARREVAEEIGVQAITPDPPQALIMHHRDERGERIYAFFVVEDWMGNPVNKEPTRCDGIEWFPLDNLPANTAPHIVAALRGITDGIRYVEYGFAKP